MFWFHQLQCRLWIIMKSSRSVAYWVLIYSVVSLARIIEKFTYFFIFFYCFIEKIIGITFNVLSTLSMIARGCEFNFKQSSVTHMLDLIYYRCDARVNWTILTGVRRNLTIQPDMPVETQAILRTYVFTNLFLVLSILLLITCVLGFCESPADNEMKIILISNF